MDIKEIVTNRLTTVTARLRRKLVKRLYAHLASSGGIFDTWTEPDGQHAIVYMNAEGFRQWQQQAADAQPKRGPYEKTSLYAVVAEGVDYEIVPQIPGSLGAEDILFAGSYSECADMVNRARELRAADEG